MNVMVGKKLRVFREKVVEIILQSIDNINSKALNHFSFMMASSIVA
jgi:hypothetical protein